MCQKVFNKYFTDVSSDQGRSSEPQSKYFDIPKNVSD